MKKINFKKIFSIRNTVFSLSILAVVFLLGHFVFADSPIATALGNVVGGVISIFINAVVQILILLVNLLMLVASYSDFIHAPAVEKGWVVVRDLCNMFFVVILLIIAFATILGQEEYGAKKMLPKLIMAAVLINFSKLFCGLMIDISNVIMLTFVNAFSAIGAGNMIEMLGISEVVKIASNDSNAAVTFSTVVATYIFGLIYVVIATIVVAAMVAMLVVRLVMIWILIVLSPFAFFLQSVPGKGKQYAEKWWGMWTENMLVGPIIAFFLWLSFAALQNGSSIIAPNSTTDLNAVVGPASQAGTLAGMSKFAIAIGMLIGGMGIAKDVGGTAGKAMGQVFSKGKGLATAAGIGAVVMGAKATGRGALGATGKMANVFSEKTIDQTTGKEVRKGNAFGNFALGWQADLQASNKKAKKEAAAKYLKKIGIGEKGSETGQTLIDTKGFQYVSNTVKGAATGFVTGGFVGAGAGAVAGASGTAARQKIKSDIKDYEGAKGKLDSTRSELDSAKISRDNANKKSAAADAELSIAQGHEQTVTDFDNNKQEFDRLEALGAGVAGLANTRPDAEKKEYKRLQKIIQDKAVINNYSKSKKYLTDNDITEKKQASIDAKKEVVDADNEVINKEAAFTAEEANFNSRDKAKYQSNKDWEKRTNFADAFKNTKAAMADQTKKSKAAKDWVKMASNDKNLLENMGGKGNIYSSAGASETWKKRLDTLNGGGGDSDTAIANMVSEIDTDKVEDGKMKEFAKLLAAYRKGGGTINSATLGKIETALTNKGHNSNAYDGKVSTQYKQLGSFVEDVKDGSGSLQFDSFAKNSSKPATSRNEAKDVMGASFEKINNKAKELGVDYNLDATAGVNQKVEGAKLSNLSKVMSGLIDDEIKALQQVGGDVNNQKINQLNTAKSRLDSGDISGMSLKNTDVVYKGDNDSERRRNEYNTTQHETMHQYGAQNEDLVDSSASALQDSKLVGRIPASDQDGGKRYDEVIGKMIANMEQAQVNPEAIKAAVEGQISKWSPSNAQRVVETENGKRDVIKDIVPESDNSAAAEKFETVVNKLMDRMDKEHIGVSGNQKSQTTMSLEDRNFFMRSFNSLKKTVSRGDELVGNKLKPLSAIAMKNEMGGNETE
jgi:hypothetical protein